MKVCTLDQSDDTTVQDFVEQVKSEENQVDLLVNSAFAGLIAITPHFGKPFWERPLSVFDASLTIGLRSAHVMSALVAPLMVKNKTGLMVQVSSSGGVKYVFDVGYGVGKAGLDRLTTDMAAELKPYNVHAVTLYPGAGVTEVTAFPGGETPCVYGAGRCGAPQQSHERGSGANEREGRPDSRTRCGLWVHRGERRDAGRRFFGRGGC